MTDRSMRHRFAMATALFLAVVAYMPLLRAPFVYEDLNWLASLGTASMVWTVPGRAVTMQTYRWTWDLVGANPALFHVYNLVLHVLNGLLVYGIALILSTPVASVIAFAVFLLHPFSTEAVAYVTGRSDLLATTGLLLAVWLTLRARGGARWLLVGPALLLAAMSKETGLVGVPLVLLTLQTVAQTAPAGRGFVPTLTGTLGLILGASATRLYTWLTLVPAGGGSVLSWPEYVVRQNAAWWQLLLLIVYPRGFTIDHDAYALGMPARLVAVVLTTGVLVLLVWAWSRRRLLAWVLACVGIAVAPRFLIDQNEFINEHQMYTAWAFLAIGSGALLEWLWYWRPTATVVRAQEELTVG